MTDRNPALLVAEGVEKALDLAATWPSWDGQLIRDNEMEGTGGEWTPAKALRRITDHLIDHLHEVEALLAGADPVPDEWQGRFVTLGPDRGAVTAADVAEAGQRVRRLARTYVLRYAAAGPAEWDKPRDPAWTLRQIAEHVSHVNEYAQYVGRLA
jgi:hypothetical protein